MDTNPEDDSILEKTLKSPWRNITDSPVVSGTKTNGLLKLIEEGAFMLDQFNTLSERPFPSRTVGDSSPSKRISVKVNAGTSFRMFPASREVNRTESPVDGARPRSQLAGSDHNPFPAASVQPKISHRPDPANPHRASVKSQMFKHVVFIAASGI
jgi:hypothetical protein